MLVTLSTLMARYHIVCFSCNGTNPNSMPGVSDQVQTYPSPPSSSSLSFAFFFTLFQMLAVRLEEVDCFSAWVMGNNTDLPGATADIKCKPCLSNLNSLHVIKLLNYIIPVIVCLNFGTCLGYPVMAGWKSWWLL